MNKLVKFKPYIVLIIYATVVFQSCKREKSEEKNAISQSPQEIQQGQPESNGKQKGLSEKRNIPYRKKLLQKDSLAKYLTKEEKNLMEYDSLDIWNKFMEIAKERWFKYKKIPNVDYLTIDEALTVIMDSTENWSSKQELALQRKQSESLRGNYIDSLKGVIHPIDSTIPFGPAPLLKLSSNRKRRTSFTKKVGKALQDTDSTQSRKAIYESWMFFLKLNMALDDSTEDSYGKFLPSITNYDFILEDKLQLDNYKRRFKEIYLNNSFYSTRIGNIGIYEVYYYVLQLGDSFGCHPYDKPLEDCCYTPGYDCDYEGFVLLYDRSKKYAEILHAYYIAAESFRFFSITEDEVIHVFQGERKKSWDSRNRSVSSTDSISMELKEEFRVRILEDSKILLEEN